jgi:hypothetical protein
MTPDEFDLVIRRMISIGTPKETWNTLISFGRGEFDQDVECEVFYIFNTLPCSPGLCLYRPHVLLVVVCQAGVCRGLDNPGPFLRAGQPL